MKDNSSRARAEAGVDRLAAIRPAEGWAIVGPDGHIYRHAVRPTKRSAIDAIIGPGISWLGLQQEGWRCVRVRIAPVRPSDAKGGGR